jgi:uncharacterized glyoxalase superfamily protein PhnB
MAGLTPYLHFPGTAREALTFYGDVFGCAVELHTFAEFNRTDGPADAIAHGYLAEGPVALYGADVSGDERPFRAEGMMLALLGTAAPSGRSSTGTVCTGSSGSKVTRTTEPALTVGENDVSELRRRFRRARGAAR